MQPLRGAAGSIPFFFIVFCLQKCRSSNSRSSGSFAPILHLASGKDTEDTGLSNDMMFYQAWKGVREA